MQNGRVGQLADFAMVMLVAEALMFSRHANRKIENKPVFLLDIVIESLTILHYGAKVVTQTN